MTTFAITLQVYDLTRSPAAVGGLGVAMFNVHALGGETMIAAAVHGLAAVQSRTVPSIRRIVAVRSGGAAAIREVRSRADYEAWYPVFGASGLVMPTWAPEYGGLGLTMEEEVEVAFEIGKTSPAFRSLIGTNNGIGSQGIIGGTFQSLSPGEDTRFLLASLVVVIVGGMGSIVGAALGALIIALGLLAAWPITAIAARRA